MFKGLEFGYVQKMCCYLVNVIGFDDFQVGLVVVIFKCDDFGVVGQGVDFVIIGVWFKLYIYCVVDDYLNVQ